MELRNPMKTNPASESAHALEVYDDLKINDHEEDEITTDNSEKDKSQAKTKDVNKKRRPVTSESVRFMYESPEFKFKKALKNTQQDAQQRKLDTLREKVKTGFKNELKSELLRQKNPAAAALFQDRVELKSNINKTIQRETEIQDKQTQEKTQKTQKTLIKKSQKRNQLLQRPDLHTPLKEYIATYGDTLLKKSPQSKQKLEALQNTLKKEGISTKQLRSFEKGAQSIIQNDLKKMLKRNFTKLALSYEKKPTFELLNNYTAYYSMLESAKELDIFNAQPDELKKIKTTVKKDIANFLTTELDRNVVEKKLQSNSIAELKNVFGKFNGIADFSQFNANEYMRSFQQKLEDQGLKPFMAPNAQGTIDSDTADQSKKDSKSQQQDQEPADTYQDHESEIEQDLINLYIKSHFIHNLFESIKHKLIIRKKESISKANNINIEKIKKQAYGIALLRARMKCRSLFEQRATLTELKGPEYNAFKKELKLTLKTLKKLNRPITKKELEELKNQSNRSIFSIVKEDYIKNEIFLESQPNHIGLLHQKKRLIAIINRLMTETKITEDLNPKLMQDLHFLNDVNINEAA